MVCCSSQMITHHHTFTITNQLTNYLFSWHSNNLYLSHSFTLLLQYVSTCVGHHQVSFIYKSKVCIMCIAKLFFVIFLAVFVWCTAVMVCCVTSFTSIFYLLGKSGSYPSFLWQCLFWQQVWSVFLCYDLTCYCCVLTFVRWLVNNKS
jgi:hypothetical protein